MVAQTLDGHRPVEADIVIRVGAEDRNLQANGTLLHDDGDGADVGAVVVLNDVTRLKRLEAVRRDFVANVSHELKTPVTSIKGFAETLEDGALDDPEAARRFVRIIAGQADRLNSIIEDLLALSTLEQSTDSPLLQLEEADLCDVVAVALEVCGPKAEVKRIDLREECPGCLIARVSPPLLEQAVVNLVDNAIKYSAEGSEVLVPLDRVGRRDRRERRATRARASPASTCRGSSSASTASTRRAAATSAAPASAWPSSSTSPRSTAAGSRSTASSAGAAPSASTSREARRADPAAHGRLPPASLWPIRGPHAGLTFLSSPANRECAD